MTDTKRPKLSVLFDPPEIAEADDVLRRKLIDAEVPGSEIEFDPDEADRAGAFVENALSEEDAREAEDGSGLSHQS